MTSPAGRSAAVALVLCACAPALDWRDVRPADSGLSLQFPCRPTAQQRRVALAGVPVRLALHACSVGGQTWGLGWADVADPAQVAPALQALRASAAANIGARDGQVLPLRVPGATPSDAAARLRLAGRLPDGAAVQMELAVFAIGTHVFQASVVGTALGDEAAENFFASLRAGR
jgi:hypothetical protein